MCRVATSCCVLVISQRFELVTLHNVSDGALEE